ncbi:MAG: hypothetical protein QOI84_517 [Solirubrobacterales bacterium]|nr:hypothetical protein [Solirubrobacterales bacterium]
MKARMIFVVSALAAVALLAAGCGGGNSSATETTAPAGAGSQPAESAAGGSEGAAAGAEAAPSEAKAAATGDIPDNQVFLLFRDPGAGYSVRYPEGWARKGSGNDVTFQEKANVIHIAVAKGPAPTEATAVAGIEQMRKGDPTVHSTPPEKLTVNGAPVVKVTYTRLSAPDPVTGKRLQLTIDRYLYGKGGKVAVIDLGTPVGVDNVDAYRMISESFQWR